MTTSGVTTYTPARDTLLKKALRMVGAYPSFGVPRPEQLMDANEALNMMLPAWQVQNNIWLRQFVTLYLVPGQRVYSLPGANGASIVVETELDAVIDVVPDTTITVLSTTGMTAGDIIGVLMDDSTIHWTTITTVDSTTTLTLTSGVTGVSALGNGVYTYTSTNGLYRPTRVFSAKRIDADGYETPLRVEARDTYNQHNDKSSNGTPTEVYYDAQMTPGKLYVWSPTSTAATRILLDVDRPINVVLDSSDTFDLPMEWQELVAYALAVRLAVEYKLPVGERQLLAAEYANLLANAVANNIEHVSTYFQPGE